MSWSGISLNLEINKLHIKNYIMPEQINHHFTNRSPEITEIITSIPSWITSWGISIIFLIILMILGFSNMISYPDVITVPMKINSLNSPKPIFALQNGKLGDILVQDGDSVVKGQILAYLETAADAKDVILMKRTLKDMEKLLRVNKNATIEFLPDNLILGELQQAFSVFYQQYLQYKATRTSGFYSKSKSFLKEDLRNVNTLNKKIIEVRESETKQYQNIENEYLAYKKLYEGKVISKSEFLKQENNYLAARSPLYNNDLAFLNNRKSYLEKEKQILEVENFIDDSSLKFQQSINQFLSECELWIMKNSLKASVSGHVNFAGIIQQNQKVNIGEELFVINQGDTDFFGEIKIPQENMGKIRKGEDALIKLKSYPFEQYGMLKGKLSYLSNVAYKDSVFLGRIALVGITDRQLRTSEITLKNGMLAEAQIITEESTLFKRLFRTVIAMLNKR